MHAPAVVDVGVQIRCSYDSNPLVRFALCTVLQAGSSVMHDTKLNLHVFNSRPSPQINMFSCSTISILAKAALSDRTDKSSFPACVLSSCSWTNPVPGSSHSRPDRNRATKVLSSRGHVAGCFTADISSSSSSTLHLPPSECLDELTSIRHPNASFPDSGPQHSNRDCADNHRSHSC